MSRESELDALIRAARRRKPRERWSAQRRLFGRFALGGTIALLLARAHAFVSATAIKTVGPIAIVAATLASVYAATYSNNDVPIVPPADVEAAPAPVSSATPADPPEGPPSLPATSVDTLPSAATRPRPARKATSNATQDAGDDLAKETASIASIRSKLAAHDYWGALAGVRQHRATFPRGVLLQEAAVLEIETLERLGQHDRACALGRSFLDGHPASAHREHVITLTRECNY